MTPTTAPTPDTGDPAAAPSAAEPPVEPTPPTDLRLDGELVGRLLQSARWQQ